MKISELITEAIRLRHAKKYRKVWNPNLYKDIFTKWPGMKDRNSFRIYLPYDNSKVKTVTIPTDIKNYLKEKGYEIQDYLKGLAIQKDTKRIMKIGRLLSDNNSLQKKFNEDSQRSLSKTKDKLVVISRHPYDIAGQSTGRGWTSCTNIEDGEHRKYVMRDIKEGTLVAYLIDSNDKNIKTPISRILIKPFLNIVDANDIVVFPEQKQYGASDSQFYDIVDEWTSVINGPEKSGLYCINKKVYKDTIDSSFIGDINKLSKQEQLKILKEVGSEIKNIKNPSEDLQLVAVNNDGKNLKYILKNGIKPSDRVQIAAILNTSNTDISMDIFTDLIDHGIEPCDRVKLEAVKADPSIIQYITNPDEKLQLIAVNNDWDSLIHILNNNITPSEKVQLLAIRYSDECSVALIKSLLDHNIELTEKVKLAAVKLNSKCIKIMLEHGIIPSEQLQLIAIRNDDFDDEKYIIQYLNDYDVKLSEKVQLASIQSDSRSIRYIKSPSEDVQLAAVSDNAELIHDIIFNDIIPSEEVQLEAVSINGLTIEYLIDAGINPSEEVQIAAVTSDKNALDFIKNPSEKVIMASRPKKGKRRS